MKKPHSGTKTKNKGFGLSMLMAALLFSTLFSTIARADVVLDWNKIAVDTAVANKQNPFAQARYAAIVQLAGIRSRELHHARVPSISWDHNGAAGRFSRSCSHRGRVSGA